MLPFALAGQMWSLSPTVDQRMSPEDVQESKLGRQRRRGSLRAREPAQIETWQPFVLSLSLVLSFLPVRYPSELNLLLPLYLSLYLPCGLANKNKTQNARRRGGKRRGVCEWVYVCELDILSRPGGGQFLRWPSFLAVGRFVVWGCCCC